MTKDEFIKTACSMGYCTKKIAEEYSEGKETFTDDDYIEVYRIVEERQRYQPHGHHLGDGSYTSKRFYRDGGEEGNR